MLLVSVTQNLSSDSWLVYFQDNITDFFSHNPELGYEFCLLPYFSKVPATRLNSHTANMQNSTSLWPGRSKYQVRPVLSATRKDKNLEVLRLSAHPACLHKVIPPAFQGAKYSAFLHLGHSSQFFLIEVTYFKMTSTYTQSETPSHSELETIFWSHPQQTVLTVTF